MIVYEYLPKGNLGTALYGKEAGNLLVDWVSQYNVAIGVAEGLNYLHHDCHPQSSTAISSPTTYYLIQTSRQIANFGLAKMMSHKNETVLMVAGSYGYIAPEYGYTLKIDERVTGEMPLNPAFGESVDIVEWIRRKIKTSEEALDHSIAGHCKHVQEEILLVLRIAILCTAKHTKDRPSMRDVITKLGEAFVKMEHRILAKIGQSLATHL